MSRKIHLMKHLLCFLCLFSSISAVAEPATETPIELRYLKEAYPDMIQEVSPEYIAWKDGTRMRIRQYPAFIDQFVSLFHQVDHSAGSVSIKDLQCDTYEPFFKKMYGHTAKEVKKKLVTIYWMPKVFGNRYPLKVTTVNGIDKKIRHISAELEKLPPSYYKYLDNPGGAFYWRNVKHETYLSAHSFGIALDINSQQGNYWLWDWEKANRPPGLLTPHNNIPLKIVQIFEKEGFLWGGRWYFYDTMHFEYRPELFARDANSELRYNNDLGLRCNA